jgi:hypothetical protein
VVSKLMSKEYVNVKVTNSKGKLRWKNETIVKKSHCGKTKTEKKIILICRLDYFEE